MRKVGFLILLFCSNVAFSQEVLVPFRVGNLFGLSDVKGNLKVKPAYDYIEPIGEGYYKYSNFTKVPDTIHWVGGRIEIREKTNTVTGVLFGTKVIIHNSLSRHFTVVKNAMLIGSEESYISKNSNFYNLKGKKLLSENVEKFKFLATDKMPLENTPMIAVFAEHFDKSFSVLLYDTKKQDFIKPLISHGQNVKVERRESTEDYIVISYNDEKYNSYKVSIYFDDKKKTFVKEPFSYNRDFGEIREGIRADNDVVVESPGYQGDRGPAGDPDAPVKYNSTESKPAKPVVIPRKIYPFIRVNDSLYTYNGKEIKPSSGEKILFAERYNKSQMQPLIFTDGGKYGLIFSDSLRSQVLYDSLRYIKNQYSMFTSGYNMLYLAGKKNNENSKLIYGILDEKGNEIIPMVYDYVSPNLSEIHQTDNEGKKRTFEFRQPYNYSNDKNALLTLTREGLITVGQNGKFGVVNLKNDLLLPIEYDNVWKNGFSFLKTFKVKEDFYVYKKGELYGVFKFDSKEITNNTGLKFPMIPVYLYQDYMGIKGLNIYSLAIEGDLFFCLAADNGTVYYRK